MTYNPRPAIAEFNAVFIGGAYDRTSQKLTEKLHFVYFFEPLKNFQMTHPHHPDFNDPSRITPCHKLVYKLIGITPNEVLLYEFQPPISNH